MIKDNAILIISPEKWGVSKVSKHHYAKLLSERNMVYFLNPSSNVNSLKKIEEQLYVIDYKKVRGINYLPKGLRKMFQQFLIAKIHKISGVSKFDLVWSFDPYSFQCLKAWKASLNIYHAMDHHKSEIEMDIANQADLILAPSDLILSKFNDVNAMKFKINHGVNDDFLNYKASLNHHNEVLNIGYIGNLSSGYLALDILGLIIKENNSVNFNLIGPAGSTNLSKDIILNPELNQLLSLPNVSHFGELGVKDAIEVLEKCDGFLLCYRGDKISISNSHKILEYMSFGKVIFSGPIDEYSNSDLLVMTKSIDDLPKVFKAVIAKIEKYNTADLVQERIKFANDNSYRRQLSKVEQLIEKLDLI